jgi:hypothetical protein
MGSVNERGFLMFFAFFLPSLEGIAGPKKQKQVAVVDTSGEKKFFFCVFPSFLNYAFVFQLSPARLND